uniref:TeximYa n=1 Tax=Kryptolebias marmoratus TaxID=37003 RepID=A0A3Q3AXP9_KRYMA
MVSICLHNFCFFLPFCILACSSKGSGTRWRHKGKPWPRSEVTGLFHKLVVPERRPDKKLVLLIGESHLRLFVDGIVTVSDGNIDFGVMCTPGACASKLRQQVLHSVTTCQPDAVCVLAPSNNLTASINPEEAEREFEQYLLTVCSRWPKVFCTGMVPQYHRRSAKLGIPFFPIANDLPLGCRELWSHNGVHLSNDHGMPILSQLMWIAAYQFLEKSEPKPLIRPQSAPTYVPRIVPHVVVKVVERPPPPPSSEWTTMTSGRKIRRNYSGESDSSCHSSKKGVIPDKVMALKELNPVRFSADMLVAMEKVSLSAVDDVHTGNKTKPVEHPKKPAVSRTRRVRQQVEATPKPVGVCDVPRSPPPRETSSCLGWVCPLEVPAGQEVCIVTFLAVNINK